MSDAIFVHVARRLMAYFSRPTPNGSRAAFPELTDREREILELVAQVDRTPTSPHLVLSPKTVRNHVSNIFSKFRCATAPRRSCAPASRDGA